MCVGADLAAAAVVDGALFNIIACLSIGIQDVASFTRADMRSNGISADLLTVAIVRGALIPI